MNTSYFQTGCFSAHKPSEDSYYVSRDGSFFGIYDGHGGRNVSEYLRIHLYPLFQLSLKASTSVEDAFTRSFARVDEELLKGINPGSFCQRNSRTAGSCGLVVYFQGEKVYTAIVGDSRAILTKRTLECVPLTKEQKATDMEERKLIIQRTGDPRAFFQNQREAEIDPAAPDRLLGHLIVTRAFGDAFLKLKHFAPQQVQNFQLPYITAEPVVTSYSLAENEEEFLVLASDGLWDMMTNEEVMNFLREWSPEWETTNVAQKLVERVLNKYAERAGLEYNQVITHPEADKYLDDITVIVINLTRRKRVVS
jgi:serine/threonine protein phosphatase PrpC